mgnify:CR=1 FL=1
MPPRRICWLCSRSSIPDGACCGPYGGAMPRNSPGRRALPRWGCGRLIVDAARDELGGAVLAQVMGQALLIKAAFKAILHHQQFMPGDGLKVSLDVHWRVPPRNLTVTLPSFNLRRSSLSEKSSVTGQVGIVVGVIQNVFLAVDGVEPLLLRRKAGRLTGSFSSPPRLLLS